MEKRGLFIILSIVLLCIVIGCSKAPEMPSQQGPVAASELVPQDSRAFVHALPNIRDAVDSTFASLNIFINDFVTGFDASRMMLSPKESYAGEIRAKAGAVEETLDSISLIVKDFNAKKIGVSGLSRSDEELVKQISSRLSDYSSNKEKFESCLDSMNSYADFVELTVKREQLISDFSSVLEKTGSLIEDNKFDDAMALGRKARSDLAELKSVDLKRSKMGVVEINSDVLFSWDLHLEAMDILLSLWEDLKADKINDAMDKAQEHYNTFTRANKYGAKEPPVADQASVANVWLQNNIGVCSGLI